LFGDAGTPTILNDEGAPGAMGARSPMNETAGRGESHSATVVAPAGVENAPIVTGRAAMSER